MTWQDLITSITRTGLCSQARTSFPLQFLESLKLTELKKGELHRSSRCKISMACGTFTSWRKR